ncbi:hypothetical protein OIU76_022987 [Salix suchowensis]|nr:hypothetical protein OIU76_022987 [Salix suchowensis]
MHLKKPLWSAALKETREPSSEAEPQPQQPSSSMATAVDELVNSLNKQRLYREVTLALRTSLRDARAEFSFLRLRGLRSLLNFLRSVAQSDSTINLFCQTQSLPDLQVVPVLFQNSLKEGEEEQNVESLSHVFGVEPMRITSPSTDAEIALALRVLEGCCLLHRESTVFAHQYKAIQVLMRILSTRGVLEKSACLDALISIMLDSSPNQLVWILSHHSHSSYLNFEAN